MSEDDLPTIVRGDETIGRALTPRDGQALVDELNHSRSPDGLRDQLLSAVTDAIEEAFEE